jgi:two-component system, OmpR family, response regulator MprA
VGARRVLVVDDDPTLRETLGEVLTDDGYDVRVAWNGQDALHKLDGWNADVVILDVMMPVMDAFGFQSALNERSEHRPPLILLSAAPGLATAADELGAVSIISKPFHLQDLIAEVRRVIGRINGAARAGV